MVILKKQPYERFTYAIDFAPKLPPGTTLLSGTIKAIDSYGQDKTASVLGSSTLTVVGAQARTLVLAGTHGEDYTLTFQMVLNNGTDSIEQDVLMQVRNK